MDGALIRRGDIVSQPSRAIPRSQRVYGIYARYIKCASYKHLVIVYISIKRNAAAVILQLCKAIVYIFPFRAVPTGYSFCESTVYAVIDKSNIQFIIVFYK